jgi:cell volume regulation protein A
MKLTVLFGTLGGLLVLAFVANRLFRRTRTPDVVVLMATGLVLGPVLGWVNASRFEEIAHAFGTLAVVLILFEGGLELDIRGTLRHFPGGLLLGVLGYAMSLALVTPVVWLTLQLPLSSALLVGAVVSCTSSAVVLPILQQLEARAPLKVTLLLEASLSDVLGVLTVGILLDIHAFGGSMAGEFLRRIFSEVSISLLLALVAGFLWSRLLPMLSEQRFWQVLTFSAVLLLYAGSEALHANGLISVLGFGLTLANFPGIDQRLLEATLAVEAPTEEHHQQILTFHSELAFLVRTFFFVLLGVVVKVAGLGRHLPTIMGILGALLVARWLAVRASRWSWREIDERERELVFWLLPRGLITAVLALQVMEARGEEFAALPTVAFAIVLVTNLLVVLGTVRARRHPAVSAPAAAEADAPPSN